MSFWNDRIRASNKVYEKWAERFRCNKLIDNYEGFQWQILNGDVFAGDQKYVLNLIQSTIQIKLAGLLFQRPSFVVAPAPGFENFDADFAAKSAMLKQDVLNAIVSKKDTKFVLNYKLAALDSFFSYGIIETGYSASWENPKKLRPLMKSDEEKQNDQVSPSTSPENDKVVKSEELTPLESIYVKRIKPERFRVSGDNGEDLDACNWYGYYQHYNLDLLKESSDIKFPKNFDIGTSGYSSTYDWDEERKGEALAEFARTSRTVKCWNIWDNVSKTKKLILDKTEDVIYEEDFEYCPLTTLRWILRTSGWYPIPPVFSWLSSQHEINESREQQRAYRRRFTRKFQVRHEAIDPMELEKFATGEDGTIVTVKMENAIQPIQNPDVGPSLENALVIAKDDFNIVSGTSSEARGQADRTTATQAKIVDARSNIRESSEKLDFGEFCCDGARNILIAAKENLVGGMWIKLSADPSENFLGEVQAMGAQYKYVTSQEIDDGYDFTIAVDILNNTPQAQAERKQAFIEFISLLTKFPQIALSPKLIREAARSCNFNNEALISEFQKTALMQMVAQQQAAQAGQKPANPSGSNPDNFAKEQLAQSSPNSTDQIDAQLQQQVQ